MGKLGIFRVSEIVQQHPRRVSCIFSLRAYPAYCKIQRYDGPTFCWLLQSCGVEKLTLNFWIITYTEVSICNNCYVYVMCLFIYSLKSKVSSVDFTKYIDIHHEYITGC